MRVWAQSAQRQDRPDQVKIRSDCRPWRWLDSSAYRWLCFSPVLNRRHERTLLFSATADLDARNLEEVILYARFRKA
jgi:hypothetical protein